MAIDAPSRPHSGHLPISTFMEASLTMHMLSCSSHYYISSNSSALQRFLKVSQAFRLSPRIKTIFFLATLLRDAMQRLTALFPPMR